MIGLMGLTAALPSCSTLWAQDSSVITTTIDSLQMTNANAEGLTDTTLKPKSIQPSDFADLEMKPIKQGLPQTLLFYWFAFIVAIFTFLKYYFAKYVEKLIASFWSFNITQQMYEDYKQGVSITAILLMVNVIAGFSVAIYLLLNYFEVKPNGLSNAQLLLLITSAVGAYIGLRRLLLSVAAVVLPESATIKFYQFNLTLIYAGFVAMLTPALIVFAFANGLLKKLALVAMLIILIVNILRLIFRGTYIAKDLIKLHKFHFFIYLCSFEIAPLLLVFKFTNSTIF